MLSKHIAFYPDPRECAEFPNFKTLTQDQVSLIIGKAANKSCPLDPAPTSVVLQVLDVLLPIITCMINMLYESVSSRRNGGRHSYYVYKNFRPVSNLPYVSKLSERAAADQLIDQLQSSHSRLTCKKHDSTESALLKVKNDILLNMDGQKVILLVLLYLSAVFDTVRHDILLDRLRSRLGVTDQALNWFTSYLSDRTLRVSVNEGLSDTFPLA